jgi:hypothetical protein
MIIKRILAAFGHRKSKSFLYDFYKNQLSTAIVLETKALDEYQNSASSDAQKMANNAEVYFLSKWSREELEKKVAKYAG